jgi:hypothetical protein
MTKKDFELIARAMDDAQYAIRQKENPEAIATLLDGVSYACDYIADALATSNPRFDRERFLTACGVQSSAPFKVGQYVIVAPDASAPPIDPRSFIAGKIGKRALVAAIEEDRVRVKFSDGKYATTLACHLAHRTNQTK